MKIMYEIAKNNFVNSKGAEPDDYGALYVYRATFVYNSLHEQGTVSVLNWQNDIQNAKYHTQRSDVFYGIASSWER